ncbi:nesprin-3 [Erethizon dorsatum]
MTQQPQEGFDRSVEEARAWMQAVQERLQVNDNTQGPLEALEARLQETEKICRLEPEGQVKVDLVLRAAEALLACCLKDQRPEILARLRDLKDQWEETVTYMTHCHSRIEWVWLHWREYLLARGEFYRWFQKMVVTLEPPAELQLGLKEKQWQLSDAQVLLHNVKNQAELLDRLLEEAASLFNRIGDPSVDEDAQKRMKAEYDTVKAKAQDRVDLLARVAQEHEEYQAGVDEFQLWLKAAVEKVQACAGSGCQLTTELRLSALQDIAKDFSQGEMSLRRLEAWSEGIIQNTSPLGAEKIARELEEMRKVLEKQRVLWEEEETQLRDLLSSKGTREQQLQRLEAELGEFRKGLQRLAQGGLEPSAMAMTAGTEDELVARWRLYSASRAALTSEEPRVDRLQAQLKELVAFPDLQPLCDSVVATIQEYKSMKGKSTRLCNAARVELWQRFQRPFHDLQLWQALAQRLLDVTASLPDLPSIHTFLPQIKAALAESSRLKEQLAALLLKTDVLSSVFGQERASGLLAQAASCMQDRELLHSGLLQRKGKLQSLLAQHKDFGAAFAPLQRKMLDLQARLQAEKGLQRDLPGKQAQLLRLQGLQEEGLELEVQVEAVRCRIQEDPNHQHKMDQLSSDYQALRRSLEDLMDKCQQSVREHCTFSHQLLELQQWITMVTQKLESHRGDVGPWNAESREAGVETLVAELPEKEASLALVEAHSRLVMEKSSPEGVAEVQEELRELAESWRALRLLEEDVLSLIRNRQLQSTEVDSGKKLVFTNNIPKLGFLINTLDPIPRRQHGANLLEEDEGSHEDFFQLLRNFEQWLQVENSKLVRIIVMRATSAKDMRTREAKLQELQARVPEGQNLFENLLHLGPLRAASEELEDLRYRWMLYKSKLKDASRLLVGAEPQEGWVAASLSPERGLEKRKHLPKITLPGSSRAGVEPDTVLWVWNGAAVGGIRSPGVQLHLSADLLCDFEHPHSSPGSTAESSGGAERIPDGKSRHLLAQLEGSASGELAIHVHVPRHHHHCHHHHHYRYLSTVNIISTIIVTTIIITMIITTIVVITMNITIITMILIAIIVITTIITITIVNIITTIIITMNIITIIVTTITIPVITTIIITITMLIITITITNITIITITIIITITTIMTTINITMIITTTLTTMNIITTITIIITTMNIITAMIITTHTITMITITTTIIISITSTIKHHCHHGNIQEVTPSQFLRDVRWWHGPCSLLRKACCMVLWLQLLLLLFLLLLFLLPAGQEARGCTGANNFASSFMLMLRYDGPPPT